MYKDDKIKCELVDREITDGECFDVHMVIENGAPLWTAPQDIVTIPDFKKKCKRCKYYNRD